MSIKLLDPIVNERNISYINKVVTNLKSNLGLLEVELPMFIEKNSYHNDGLNGESPVSFTCTGNNKEYEVVHSHAKLKRHYLSTYRQFFSDRFIGDMSCYNGIVTRMSAVRAFEEQDTTHHYNVRQLDICLLAPKSEIQRTIKSFVIALVKSLEIPGIDHVEFINSTSVPQANNLDDITNKREQFELECGKKYGAFVILGIGPSNPCNITKDGHKYGYDHRSPDYDHHVYNGDILIYHPVLERSIEICSFGYRVNGERLLYQMKSVGQKLFGPYHDDLVNNKLVQTIGGGIGIDRLLMVRFGELSVHSCNPN